MNKTDRLLQMMEQPQRYTADEWQEILADDECRELYTLMSKTQSAIDAARADKEVTDDMIDAEWQRLTNRLRRLSQTLNLQHPLLNPVSLTQPHCSPGSTTMCR